MNKPCARITLDLQQASTPTFVAVKKSDIGREIRITLSDGGFPYEISADCYAVLTGTKPDGNILYNHCDIEGNTIVYEITEQTTAAAGRMKAEVKLYGADDVLVTSATFRIIIDGTVYTDDKVESSSEFSALTQLISQVLEVLNSVDPENNVGIKSIEQTVTSTASMGKNVITATLTDGTTTEFIIRNGAAGVSITGPQGPQGPMGFQGIPGRNGADGSDGGYYVPVITQIDDYTIQIDFTPSDSKMPAVESEQIVLPAGTGSGGNVDLSGYLKLPTNEDGTPNHGTAGYYAISDGNGGVTWVAAGNSGGSDTPVVPGSHGVVWDLTNVTSSSAVTSVSDGASLIAVLTPADGYTLGDVTVTMGGEVLTGVWNADTATVTIASVTGDVVISCAGVERVGPVDTSPVIAEYDKGLSSTLGTINTFAGMCYTKVYEFEPDIDALKASSYYDAENDYLTLANINGCVTAYCPTLKMRADGNVTTSMATKASKVWLYRDDTPVHVFSNASTTAGENPVPIECQFVRQKTDSMYANGIAFTLGTLDIDDSYAYWTTKTGTILPIGVRAGDIIFAGKNTEYYGMANIDGTMAGQTATTELSYDDDVAQNYAVATESILGEETATDTSTAYGISSGLAAVIDEVRTAWMLEYGGDYRKIPMILTADQHGRRNEGIWNMLAKTLSLHDVSKICNLGDTVSVEWQDADTTQPLISCSQLESWCESIKAIPFSKRLDVYGNHDTWYGNYADEGNTVGTRYPANQSHLDQYFRNIYARRNNNNGWFVIRDDYFNVKYVVISGFEYAGTVTFRIGTNQMQFIIDEFGKDDGYDVVVVSHVPLYYQMSTNGWPTNSRDDVSDTTIMRVADIDTDALFTARKNKTSGTVTDSEGVEHSFDFSDCTTDILCSLHGHTHDDSYNYTGGVGLLSETFDWFDENTVHFVLVDRVNRQLNVWKLEGDALTYQNYQVPLDKPTA